MTAQGRLAAACLVVSASAHAMRMVPGTLTVDVAEVFMTRSITVGVVLEDDQATGADGMEISLLPDPPQSVRLIGGTPPTPFSCSPTGGQTAGSWVFEAAAPGRVRFRLVASGMQCGTGATDNVEALTNWITVKPLPLWSELVVEPRTVAPGGTVSLTLIVRNDAAVEAACTPPAATEDYRGRNQPQMAALGTLVVDPPEALRNPSTGSGLGKRVMLSPGRRVAFTWRFKALTPGEARFQIIGAGLVVMSPPVQIRPAGGLSVNLMPLPPTGVGREVTVRARIHLAGDTPVRDVWAGLTWSPTGAVRLLRGGCSSTDWLAPDHDKVAASFILDVLAPGPVTLSVSAGGREADSGRAISAAPATGSLFVQSPAVLTIELVTPTATVLAASRTAFTVRVSNGTKSATQGMSPIVSVRRGRAALQALSPLFQVVPARGTAVFTGAFVSEGAGEIELAAQATTRDDRGGPWVTTTATPIRFLSVPLPRLEVFSLHDRVAGGVTASVRFLLRNASPFAFAIRSATITLAGSADQSIGQPTMKPARLDLAAGASATMTVTAWLPPDKKAYWVTGQLSFTGTITAWRLPCTVQVGSRPLAFVVPRVRGIVWTEPEGIFRPPLDPLLGIAWSLTIPGMAGVAVTAADGRLIHTLVELKQQSAGTHDVLWSGETGVGAPVPPGVYQLRLAGPVSGTTSWPAGARWHDAVPLEIKRP